MMLAINADIELARQELVQNYTLGVQSIFESQQVQAQVESVQVIPESTTATADTSSLEVNLLIPDTLSTQTALLKEAMILNTQTVVQSPFLNNIQYQGPFWIEALWFWSLQPVTDIMPAREQSLFLETLPPKFATRIEEDPAASASSTQLEDVQILTQIRDQNIVVADPNDTSENNDLPQETIVPVNRVLTRVLATCSIRNQNSDSDNLCQGLNTTTIEQHLLEIGQTYAISFRADLRQAAKDDLLTTKYFENIASITVRQVQDTTQATKDRPDLASRLLTQQEPTVNSTPLGFWLILASNVLLLVLTGAYILYSQIQLQKQEHFHNVGGFPTE